jgi:2-octaprenylphenol hydroxylase
MGARSTVGVIGGGLVGAAAALGLARDGFNVTLIDRRQPQVVKGALGIDIRNVALSPASQQLLDRLGVWSRVETAPYDAMCVWEHFGTSQLEFHAADVGRCELGWLVEMSPLICAAWAELGDIDHVEVLLADIDNVVPDDAGVSVHFTPEADIAPRLFDFLVAADGAQSVVRDALNLAVIQQPLDQVAIATVVQTSDSHQHTAWQRFLSEGPLAFLPAPDDHLCSIVWSQTEATAKRRLALDDEAFCAEIEHAIEGRLGKVIAVDQRFSFGLTQQRVKSCTPHARVVMIGDAMRVVHPLAGLGVNLGLEDVSRLLEVAHKQHDLSQSGIWRRYARQRQVRSQMMIQTMSALQKFYGSANPAVALLRNFGVQSFNALDTIKRQVMREAMGLGQLSGATHAVSGDSDNMNKTSSPR